MKDKPAFPVIATMEKDATNFPNELGMTLREYYAIEIEKAFIIANYFDNLTDLRRNAVLEADALIKQLTEG